MAILTKKRQRKGSRCRLSELGDSNARPLRPERSALPTALNSDVVGMTGFEPATTRPPDEYSNRTELHPAFGLQKYAIYFT